MLQGTKCGEPCRTPGPPRGGQALLAKLLLSAGRSLVPEGSCLVDLAFDAVQIIVHRGHHVLGLLHKILGVAFLGEDDALHLPHQLAGVTHTSVGRGHNIAWDHVHVVIPGPVDQV